MKRVLALVLTLLMVFALTACGGKTEPTPSGGTTAPEASQQQEAPADLPENSTPEQAPADSDPVYETGVWPDTEWTQQVPEPPFTVGEVSDEFMIMKRLDIYFTDVTYEGMSDYREQLRAAGFDQAETDLLPNSTDSITWQAENADGSWHVCISSDGADGTGWIQITKLK